MKKFILATILLLSCVLTSCSQEDYTNKSERERREGYKELKVYVTSFKHDGVEMINEENKILFKYCTYDERGNILTESELAGKRGEDKYTKKVYKYNQANMLLEKISYNADGERTWIESMKYHNDTMLAEKVSRSGEGKSKLEYRYDEKGNQIYSERWIPKFSKESMEFYDLQRIRENIYDYENQLVKNITIRNQINSKGKVINEENDTTISKYENTIHSIKSSDSDDDDLGNGENKKYNDKGLLVEEEKKGAIHKYKYNNKGLIIEESIYDERERGMMILIYEYN